MGRPWIDPDRVARILIWALVHGDKAACGEFGVHKRTVARYRVLLGSNQELAQVVSLRLKELRDSDDYVSKVGRTIHKALDFLERACDEMDPKNPATVTAVGEALKILFSFEVAHKIISARLREYEHDAGGDGAAGTGHQQMGAAQTLQIQEG